MIFHTLLIYCLYVAALFTAVVTALPFSDSHAWWVRGWDFPRVQIAILGLVLVVLAIAVLDGRMRAIVSAAMVICVGYQAYRIYPYTVLAPKETGLAQSASCAEPVRLMSVNVLMENENVDALTRQIENFSPHILFLMETDERWATALDPLLATYKTVIRKPQDNHYGLIFASRFEVEASRVVDFLGDDTPAIYAALRTPSGKAMRFVGLHPRPPVPGVDTEERDAEIMFSARYARKKDVPLVAMGDFNDAAWSDTARLFKHVGEFLDPRKGRGLYSSFDARSWFLRVPIDHFYHSEEVAVAGFALGEAFGSDHFPVMVQVCLDPQLAATLNSIPAPLSDAEREKADAIVTERIANVDALIK